MHVNPIEDEFQEEVLRLFAVEALDWLGQTRAALQELEDVPTAERAHILYEIVLRNLTNLKGSAATVDLPSMGNLAFMLVPLLQDMQKDQDITNSNYYEALEQGLGALSSVIQVLAKAETKGLVVRDLESLTRRQSDTLQNAVAKARAMAVVEERPTPDVYSVETNAIIAAILSLKRARSLVSGPTRNLAELVLRQIHALVAVESSTTMTVWISHIMQELRATDERFLYETRLRSTVIEGILGELQADPVDIATRESRIREALREISLLYPVTAAVEAGGILQFLHGLEMFLVNVLYKGTSVPAQRLEAVASRFAAVLTMAEEWVETGHKEWTEMGQIFTELMGSRFDPQKTAPGITASQQDT
jgi:hypothetical protein